MPTDRKTLPNRVRLARAAVPFCAVLSRSSSGKAHHITVPGTNGKTYSVFLKRKVGLVMEGECRLNTDIGLGPWCRGNNAHTVCRHGMSAVMVAAGDTDLAWCATYGDAMRRGRIDGDMVLEVVNQDGGMLCAVVRREI